MTDEAEESDDANDHEVLGQPCATTADAKQDQPEVHHVELNHRRRHASKAASQQVHSTTGSQAMVRGDAIQSLTPEILTTRSIQVSGSGFFTIISIIQGVALALLAQNTFQNRSGLVYAQSASLLMVLVVVFYFYGMVTIFLRWAPSFLDFFLPFAIASLEIPPAFFLGHPVEWNAWLGAFWILTSAGVYQTMLWSPQSQFGENKDAHRLLHRLLRELQIATASGGVGAIALAFLSHHFPVFNTWWTVAGAATALATVAVIVARMEIRSAEIYGRFGIHRPTFN